MSMQPKWICFKKFSVGFFCFVVPVVVFVVVFALVALRFA